MNVKTTATLKAKMATLTAQQSTRTLVGAWQEAAAQFVAAPVESSDHMPYLLTMGVIEDELLGRKIVLCDSCGAPEGAKHMDGMGC